MNKILATITLLSKVRCQITNEYKSDELEGFSENITNAITKLSEFYIQNIKK